MIQGVLYLIPFLHQTTTYVYMFLSISKLYLIPFLHQTTTKDQGLFEYSGLYLIPFLHQTTTASTLYEESFWLYLIPFLHQTTTLCNPILYRSSCILFHFYIKPQPIAHKTLFSSTLSPKSHSHFQRNAVV